MPDFLRWIPPDMRRAAGLITAGSVIFGALCGATAEILRDRQHSRTVRDQLAYLKQTGV
jgi:hypothetical protein